MNCLEFRRAIGTDPRGLDAAALAHRAACPRCNDVYERALPFERTLAAAIAIPVPDNLAERILLHQTTAALHEPRSRRWPVWAMAASLFVGIALAGTWGWRLWLANVSLADQAVAHLAHEPFALSARAEVDGDAVRNLFAALGAPLSNSPGAVHYLANCPVAGQRVAHLVMQRDSGPVTVLYLPRRHEPRRDFATVGVQGREARVGDGTLVLLAADAREFDAIESQFARAFESGGASATGAP